MTAGEPKTIEEKSKQIVTGAADITSDWISVQLYLIVNYPNDEKKALYHVKDANQVSAVI